MSMQRRLDWRGRLRDWADAQVGSSYQWGATDCGSLVRQALVEMFGPDVEALLPEWGSAREALKVLQTYGPVSYQLEQLGAEQGTVPFLRAGDIVIADEPDEEIGRTALMVSIDGRQCLASTKDGVEWSEPPANAVTYSLWEIKTNG